MPIKFNINVTSIVLILIVIAAVCYFLLFYTPSKLKQAEEEYMKLRDDLVAKNKELDDHIKELEADKKEIFEKLSAEEEKTAKLETEIQKGKARLANQLAKIKKMPDDEVVIKTRTYLNEYLEETEPEEKTKILEKDIFKMKTNVNWSFLAMGTNLSALTERKYLKFTLKSQLEGKVTSLENQKGYFSNLYDKQLAITEDWTKKYENEQVLRKESESLYEVCKKQLGSGKLKSFLFGSGLGAGVGLLISLLIK